MSKLYEQQIFIDEIQVYSRRHMQRSPTRAHSGGQPSIFCFALFHWSERFSEFLSLFFANPFRIDGPIYFLYRYKNPYFKYLPKNGRNSIVNISKTKS
jgi:hypothetical protein